MWTNQGNQTVWKAENCTSEYTVVDIDSNVSLYNINLEDCMISNFCCYEDHTISSFQSNGIYPSQLLQPVQLLTSVRERTLV